MKKWIIVTVIVLEQKLLTANVHIYRPFLGTKRFWCMTCDGPRGGEENNSWHQALFFLPSRPPSLTPFREENFCSPADPTTHTQGRKFGWGRKFFSKKNSPHLGKKNFLHRSIPPSPHQKKSMVSEIIFFPTLDGRKKWFFITKICGQKEQKIEISNINFHIFDHYMSCTKIVLPQEVHKYVPWISFYLTTIAMTIIYFFIPPPQKKKKKNSFFFWRGVKQGTWKALIWHDIQL